MIKVIFRMLILQSCIFGKGEPIFYKNLFGSIYFYDNYI